MSRPAAVDGGTVDTTDAVMRLRGHRTAIHPKEEP
jgi:hypothetical protein